MEDFKYLIKVSNLRGIKFTEWKHQFYFDDSEKQMIEDNLKMITNILGGGVYRMYNAEKEIIYVGKSNDIHRRLLQHVGERTNTAYFIREVKKIEYYQNNDPVMQTMLEGIFIAYHTPKYNDEVKERNGQ